MDRRYNRVDIGILREFIEGEVNDIYLFVKKHCYRDMYMSLHDYCLKDLDENDSIEKFIKATLYDYKMQNWLNKSLKITDGKYFDEYLLHCIIGEVFDRFGNGKTLAKESKTAYLQKVIDEEHGTLGHKLINEYNLSLLFGLLRNRFEKKNNVDINEVINFIEDISPENEINDDTGNDFFIYLNNLISKKNITLNQLGNESLIKKGIYDISLGKQPTKSQLIMLVIALRLNTEEVDKLFKLAREKIKDGSNSNMYSFEKDNNRDALLLHWLNNMESLKNIARKRNKSAVEIMNQILTESKFEILR